MAVRLNPYLGFRDRAQEAMEFYREVFGGELQRSTFAEFGASEDPAEQDKTMHATLVTDAGLVLMASDTPNSMALPEDSPHSIALNGTADDEAELRRYWDALSDGASAVPMPLERAPWGDVFGMCVDRFGVQWMVNIEGR